MRVCPKCNLPYPNSVERCVRDQQLLSALQEFIEDNSPLVRGTIIGEVIGNYKILKKLGAGAMGTVYQAAHLSIGKEVAIKVLKDDCAQNEHILERFYQEARSLAKLNHENIVQVLDFGCTSDGLAYLVTELLVGQSLDATLRKEKILPVAKAVGIASQICRALEAAHQLKIIHRDLKPENIHLVRFADNPDFAKLLDFGIAKQLNSLTAVVGMTKAFIGTPAYMPPEQAQEIDERSDLYSLGVIMYRMLSGVVPFEGTNMVDVLYKHLTEPPKSLQQHNSGVPKALDAIVLRCLAKQKDQRFASAQELLQALKAVDLRPVEASDEKQSVLVAPASAAMEESPTEIGDVRSLPTEAHAIQVPEKAPSGESVIFHTTLTGGSGELTRVPSKKNTLWVASGSIVAFAALVGVILFSGTNETTKPTNLLTATAQPNPTLTTPTTNIAAPTSIEAPIVEPASTTAKIAIVPAKKEPGVAIETPKPKEPKKIETNLVKPIVPIKPTEKKDPLGKPKGTLD